MEAIVINLLAAAAAAAASAFAEPLVRKLSRLAISRRENLIKIILNSGEEFTLDLAESLNQKKLSEIVAKLTGLQP